MDDPWFHGGTQGEGSGYTFEDLDLDIEADSMSLADEAQDRERTMQAFGIVSSWFPLMLQFPGAGWEAMVAEVGDRFGIPDLAAIVKVQDVIASGLMMMQAAAAAAAPVGPGGPAGAPSGPAAPPMEMPKPRLAGDLGMPTSINRGISGGLAGGKRTPPANQNKQKLGAQAAKQTAGVGGGY
jgi:hypothetical protein